MRNDKWDNNGGRLFPNPGELDVAYCGICKEKMNVTRNVVAPTSWAETMAQMKHKHDHFRCPNYFMTWHQQAWTLKEKLRVANDENVKKKLEKKIKKILKTKKATKDFNIPPYLLPRKINPSR